MDFGWTLLHAADDECTAVGSVDQGFSGSGKRSEPLLGLKSMAAKNHQLMLTLFVAWYNFCRPQMTVKTTPAVAAGLASAPWSVERLLSESARVSR
jgi:hypothetical protein